MFDGIRAEVEEGHFDFFPRSGEAPFEIAAFFIGSGAYREGKSCFDSLLSQMPAMIATCDDNESFLASLFADFTETFHCFFNETVAVCAEGVVVANGLLFFFGPEAALSKSGFIDAGKGIAALIISDDPEDVWLFRIRKAEAKKKKGERKGKRGFHFR